MAGRISQAWFDELFSRVRIDELIGEYVTLKRKGSKLWACCPFHSEKTPSFSVDAERGLYYCFGCHKGGNAITFLTEYERLEKIDAIKQLAERAHMQLPDDDVNPIEVARQNALRDKVYEANLFAARFFHQYIWKSEGAQALNYLYSRGLTDADIRRFGLGCAPTHGTELYDALVQAGFSEEIIRQAWLAGEKDGRKYDMFRDRAMFPIINQHGKVLGFGGRIMGKGEPKYLNTSDTPVFSKRNGLYGLNFALAKGAAKPQRLILVEGYMDTVMLLKHGINGVVATLGTALTTEQVLLMKRYVNQIWISYDGDSAGRKAALRALDMIEPQNLDVRVIDYPAGMDPDEYLKAYGTQAWEALPRYKAAKYRMLRAADDLDLNTQDGMTEYTVRCCEILKNVPNAVEYENYIRELSAKTGYPREVLLRQIGQTVPHTQSTNQPPNPAAKAIAINEPPKSESEKAQMQLIALYAENLLPDGILEKSDFDNPVYAELFENLSEGIKPMSIIDSLPEEQASMALAALNFQPLPDTREKALSLGDELLTSIRKQRINARISVLMQRLKTATDNEKAQITSQLNELLMKLN